MQRPARENNRNTIFNYSLCSQNIVGMFIKNSRTITNLRHHRNIRLLKRGNILGDRGSLQGRDRVWADLETGEGILERVKSNRKRQGIHENSK